MLHKQRKSLTILIGSVCIDVQFPFWTHDCEDLRRSKSGLIGNVMQTPPIDNGAMRSV